MEVSIPQISISQAIMYNGPAGEMDRRDGSGDCTQDRGQGDFLFFLNHLEQDSSKRPSQRGTHACAWMTVKVTGHSSHHPMCGAHFAASSPVSMYHQKSTLKDH